MEESCVVVTVVQGRRCVAVEFSEVFGIGVGVGWGWSFVLDKGSGSRCQVRVARVLPVMTPCLSKTKVTDRYLTRLRERQFTGEPRTGRSSCLHHSRVCGSRSVVAGLC
jgi:hypothetical protein